MQEKEKEIDDSLEKIRQLSSEVFEVAKKKLAGENFQTDLESHEIKKELRNLLNKVNFMNEIEAKRIISETMLDLDYIDNSEVRAISLRLGKLYRTQQMQKENVN